MSNGSADGHDRGNGHRETMPLQPGRRQYVKFTFFKLMPEWRRLDPFERERQAEEFAAVVEGWQRRNVVRCYSTVGTRGDVDFMLWHVSYELDDVRALPADLNGTELAGWLSTPYSYLSMTKHSTYVEKYAGPGEDRATRLSLAPGDGKYLFVYPLTKLREWYGTTAEERQEAMNQHIAIGATYPSVKINTTYSFGLDDPEFVLAFETDEPGDFLDLVQELRGSVSSAYTASDIPIFTCVATTAGDMLRALGLGRAAVPA
ncbi:MAG: chlorite dismutase family protein [Chloroflexota bacterium]|nr:chlorite dismutase family protein [Chloroflexota bacterium]